MCVCRCVHAMPSHAIIFMVLSHRLLSHSLALTSWTWREEKDSHILPQFVSRPSYRMASNAVHNVRQSLAYQACCDLQDSYTKCLYNSWMTIRVQRRVWHGTVRSNHLSSIGISCKMLPPMLRSAISECTTQQSVVSSLNRHW